MENKISKIIYWYDSNIKMYTFQVLDEEGNQLEPIITQVSTI